MFKSLSQAAIADYYHGPSRILVLPCFAVHCYVHEDSLVSLLRHNRPRTIQLVQCHRPNFDRSFNRSDPVPTRHACDCVNRRSRCILAVGFRDDSRADIRICYSIWRTCKKMFLNFTTLSLCLLFSIRWEDSLPCGGSLWQNVLVPTPNKPGWHSEVPPSSEA